MNKEFHVTISWYESHREPEHFTPASTLIGTGLKSYRAVKKKLIGFNYKASYAETEKYLTDCLAPKPDQEITASQGSSLLLP